MQSEDVKLAELYPDRKYAAKLQADFDAERTARWAEMAAQETARIRAIEDEKLLDIEMEEASQKWGQFFPVATSEKPAGFNYTVDDAVWELVLVNHRYWQALDALKRRRQANRKEKRRHHVIYVVGGMIVAIIGAVAGILALMSSAK